jgi:hypothetical protein
VSITYNVGLGNNMGNTIKPLFFQVSPDIYNADEQMWIDLMQRGHSVQILQYEEHTPDLILAPYAMRMTSDMLKNMPTALLLAIKGARALRYAPQGAEPKGKKSAKTKASPHKKSATKACKSSASREQSATGVSELPTTDVEVSTSGEYIL